MPVIAGTDETMGIVEIWQVELPAPQTERADSHAALRAIAATIPDASLTLSHTDGLALVAAAPCSVGVDIENLAAVPDAEELEDLAALTLSDRERHALGVARSAVAGQAWLQLWTRKEAALKAAGAALGDPAIRDIDAFSHSVRNLDLPAGYVGALAVADPGLRVVRRTYGRA